MPTAVWEKPADKSVAPGSCCDTIGPAGGEAMRNLSAVILVLALVPVCTVLGRTWSVNQYGTGDALTIQAGIDSAAVGDTVIVESGTYHEHDIQMKSGILLRHVNSLTHNCVIDAQGQGRVMYCDGLSETTEIKYFTFTGGQATGVGGAGSGGAIFLTNYSSPEIDMCIFRNNSAQNLGGAVYCEDHSSPHFRFGLFHENQAGLGGGGLACVSYSDPEMDNVNFWANRTGGNGGGVYCGDFAAPDFHGCSLFNCMASGHGGGVYSETNADPTIEYCTVVFSMDGEGVYAADDVSIPYFNCCDIYGNEDGDWIGRIADQDSTRGNISLDPLFCDTTDVAVNASLDVESCSPCLYGSHPWYPCADAIGYITDGCGCGEATEHATWGTIKSLYR